MFSFISVFWCYPEQHSKVRAGPSLWSVDSTYVCPRRSGLEWQENMWNRLNREVQMTSDASRLVRPGTVAKGTQ